MLDNTTSDGSTSGILTTPHNLHQPTTLNPPLDSTIQNTSQQSSSTLQPSQPSESPSATSNPSSSSMTTATTALPGATNPHNFDVTSVTPGSQNQKRPLGLTLANTNNHSLAHYPLSASATSAPLPPGPPNQSPVALLQRNASFSFASSIPSNYQSLVSSQVLASAPPSATIPSSHSSSMPSLSQASQSQIQNRARLPLFPTNPASINGRTENQAAGPDNPSSVDPSPSVRPSTYSIPASSNVPNGKVGSRDGSVLPPAALSNFPGLGFTVQPSPNSQAKCAPNVNTGPSNCSVSEAGRFFNTYIYDYLLKQGLLEVARSFVSSGTELDLIDGREVSLGSQASLKLNSNTSTSHKRRRSEGSIHPYHSPPQANSNSYCTTEGPNSATISKGGNAASELLPSERSMSSSGSTVSNASHYGFTHTDSNRSSNETPASLATNIDSAINPSGPNGTNGIGTSSHTSASPQSSPPACHLSVDALPKPKLAIDTDQGFLFEWWSIFWEVFLAKTGRVSAQSKPAQLYAQTVAAASLGVSTEASGMTRARREALGVVAVPNPLDLQKGYLNDRIQQQYTLVNPVPYSVPSQESAIAAGVRLGPHHHLQAKHVMMAEQAARQQHISRIQQQQHYQRLEVSLARQRQQQQQQVQAQAHQHQQQQVQAQQQQQQAQQQQQQQQQVQQQQQQQQAQQQQAQQQQQQQQQVQQQQQQQQELHQRTQEAHLRQSHAQSQHVHQIHSAHPDQFGQQRQISLNVRRPGMMTSVGPDPAHTMMPPPIVQHGSPLNPHQQAYRTSRPPSRSGTAHVSSPFAPNQPQPPRQPSRASNHGSSPAMQAHPRTPSASHVSTPQPSVTSVHNRGSPIVGNVEQERKKRRLNEPVFNSTDVQPEPSAMPHSAPPLHQITHQQQQLLTQHHMARQHQQQMAQHHQQQINLLQQQQQHQQSQQQLTAQPQHQLAVFQQHQLAQMQPPRRPMMHNPEFANGLPEAASLNMTVEAYKQSIHAKHSQAISVVGAPSTQKGVNPPSPNKEATNNNDDNPMPPPSGRSMATQPSTPQSSGGANKTTESTPLPSIVAPSPSLNQSGRPASRNEQNHLPGGASSTTHSTVDLRSAALSTSQPSAASSNPNSHESKSNTNDMHSVNLSADSSTGNERSNDQAIIPSETGSKSNDKSDNIWSLDSGNSGQQHQNINGSSGVSSNISPPGNAAAQTVASDELTTVNTNPMDQLFSGDSMPFDLDASLFEAFINYDHSAPDLVNTDFS